MSSGQKTYRVYCYDAARREISVDEIKAARDAEVIAQAEAASFGSMCEIWDGRRLVARLESQRREA